MGDREPLQKPRLLISEQDEPPAIPRDRNTILGRIVWVIAQGVLLFASFQVYKVARRSFIPPDATVAFDHARDILHLEEAMGLMFELDWQRWALARGDGYITFFNHLYAYYIWWVMGGMMLVAFFAPKRYQYMRRAFYISMLLVTPMYLIYPLAPPRFMADHGWNFVDTMAVYGPNYFSETGLVQANRYAAMPSMHVGWTTFTAIAISLLIPNRWLGRLLVVIMAALITYIVVITGNHYWLDALAGWMVIALALVINHLIPYPLLQRIRSGRRHAESEIAPQPPVR